METGYDAVWLNEKELEQGGSAGGAKDLRMSFRAPSALRSSGTSAPSKEGRLKA